MKKQRANAQETRPSADNRATLRRYLSKQRLQALSGPKVYPRGREYYENGRVELKQHTLDSAIGEVRGSLSYRVELKLSGAGLSADCTCPATAIHEFCKHSVALGLYLINAPPPARTTAKRGKAVPDNFAAKYPNIAAWIKGGWIEIGRDGHSTSLIRVLDEGGLIWEGGTRQQSLEAILQEAEDAIADRTAAS